MNRIHGLKFKSTLLILPTLALLSCVLSCHSDEHSEDILIGNWLGAINNEVHIFYEISEKWDGSLMGYNGIIELKLSGGPVEKITLNQDTVRFEELESNQRFVGILNRDSLSIRGKYTNLNIGNSWPLYLRRVDSLALPPRPQTPKKPYPYDEVEVVYENESAGIHIAGTLTLPDANGPSPCVLLITGSGQQNRDEETAFHHPFLVIADYLTRRGIAVLRVDDRGVGGTTRSGFFFNSTTKDLAGDVLSGVRYLKTRKEIDPQKIGLIGHSEGGLIASMVASESPDVAYIILMASPAGGKFNKGIVTQDSVEARARGASDDEVLLIMDWCKRYYDLALNEKNKESARSKMQDLYNDRTKEETEAFKKTGLSGGTLNIDYALTPHFQYFLTLNPDDFLKKVKCPVLVLMGNKDTSGPSGSILKVMENLFKISGNKNYSIHELNNLNHYFQTVKNDSSEDIEETISPIVLDIITSWIKDTGFVIEDIGRLRLNRIFITQYRHSIISKGDNLPDFDRRKDSINLFLVALHHRIGPKEFQKKAGWSDELMKEKIQFLIDKGWLINDDKGLRPSVFIVSDEQGNELYEYGMPLATEIAQSIEKEIPSIKEKFKATGLSDNYDFDSMSFLVLSNVLLDNWQIMEMEATYLKKENRPERHGKFYYASIMEHANTDYEPFGIYGNQNGKINDSTYLSIYGNNRIIVNERLKNDFAFRDSIFNIALNLTPELNNFFNEIAKDYKPKLLKVLNEQAEYSHEVYEKSGYSDEIAFEEFFIWWYHFIYTSATNILAERNCLTIPEEGNFYYK